MFWGVSYVYRRGGAADPHGYAMGSADFPEERDHFIDDWGAGVGTNERANGAVVFHVDVNRAPAESSGAEDDEGQ